MAVLNQQLDSTKASNRKTTAATRRNNRKPVASPATAPRRTGDPQNKSTRKKPRPADLPEPRPGEAASSLLSAINRHVIFDCNEIARKMVAQAKLGDMSGFRLLADLTGAKALGNQQPQKPHRQLLPWTPEHLTEQPNWQEWSDPEVDTGFGGREPED